MDSLFGFWGPLSGGQGPAPACALSLEEKDRNALREKIGAELPLLGEASIHLISQAWSVQGRSILKNGA